MPLWVFFSRTPAMADEICELCNSFIKLCNANSSVLQYPCCPELQIVNTDIYRLYSGQRFNFFLFNACPAIDG